MHKIMLNRYLPTAITNITCVLQHGPVGSNIIQNQPRAALHTSLQLRSNSFGNEQAFPSVYYYQNPLQWLVIKWQLFRLKSWDTDFNESEFKAGSSHAISSVTSIVSHERYDDLRNLLTPFALSKLRRDVLILWNDDIIRNIGLKRDDIKLAVPTRVHFRSIPLSSRRVCDIDMWYMAMKWRDVNALLVMDIVARFNRDFSKHNSEWTISFFELRKYHIQNYDKQQKVQ